MSKLDEYINHEDPRARFKAVQYVLQSGSTEGAGLLAKHVASETHLQVRAAMVQAIGQVAAVDHLALLAKLTADDAPVVRIRAVQALGQIGHAHAYPTLVRCVGRETEAKIRDVAAHFILKLGPVNVLKLFKKMIQSDKVWQRESAIMASRLFASPHVVPILEYAHKNEDGKLKDLALKGLESLANQGIPEARKVVEAIKSTAKPPPLLDLAALEAMGPISDDADFNTTYTGRLLPRVEIELDEFSESKDLADAHGSDHADDAGGLFSADPPPPRPEISPPAHARRTPGATHEAATGSPLELESQSPMGSALNGAAAFHNKENSSELPGLPGLPRSPQNPPVSRLHGAGPSAMANMEGMAGLPPPGMGGKRGLQVAAGSTAKTMPCPVCGEEIATAAKKCRFCNEVFDRVGLKEIRQSSAPSTGEIPTALSVITFLSTLGSALIALASLGLCITGEGFMVGIGSFMLVLASLQFYAAVKTRNGSAQGRDIMVKLNLFSIILSVFSFQLLQIFFGFVCHKYLTRPDVVAYCCKD